MHVIAAKAVCFEEALRPDYTEYMKQVAKNAKVLGDELKAYGFKLISGGTDNHLLLIDLTNKNITGKDAEKLLDSVGITVNKNTVPFETLSPFVTSGIRLGTPAVTTRGFKEEEIKVVARLINETINRREGNLEEIRAEVTALCSRFPIY